MTIHFLNGVADASGLGTFPLARWEERGGFLHGPGAGKNSRPAAGREWWRETLEREINRGIAQWVNPAMFLGFLAGGVACKMLRGVTGRLLFPPAKILSPLGFFSRNVAREGAAFFGETMVFTHTVRGLSPPMRGLPEGGRFPWELEYLGTASLLGSLRLFGSGSRALGKWAQDLNKIGPVAAARILPTLGLGAGIFASRRLNETLGLPTSHSGLPEWGEVLLTLAHFKAADLALGQLVRLQPLKTWESLPEPTRTQAKHPPQPPVPLAAAPGKALSAENRPVTQESGTTTAGLAAAMPSFPYRVTPEGRFELPREKHEVVVLGDLAATRTRTLALQGHRVVFIDIDKDYLADTRGYFERVMEGVRSRGELTFRPDVEWQLGDWYQTRAWAQIVEAFFPIGGMLRDPLPRHNPARAAYLRNFLEGAIHTKLGPNPKGVLILTENEGIARDLALLIDAAKDLRLLDVQFQQPQPVIGGHGITMSRASWVVYVPVKPQPG